MEPMTTAILAIITLFATTLFAKALLPARYGDRLCALCIGVSATWAGLLVLHWTGRFPDPAILALLMGSTVLGIHYTVERHMAERQKLFRLPLYLTLLFLGYAAITLTVPVSAAAALMILWAVFGSLYAYRANDTVETFVDRIIACCREW